MRKNELSPRSNTTAYIQTIKGHTTNFGVTLEKDCSLTDVSTNGYAVQTDSAQWAAVTRSSSIKHNTVAVRILRCAITRVHRNVAERRISSESKEGEIMCIRDVCSTVICECGIGNGEIGTHIRHSSIGIVAKRACVIVVNGTSIHQQTIE